MTILSLTNGHRGRKEQPLAPATSAIASSSNSNNNTNTNTNANANTNTAPLAHPQPQPQHKPRDSVDSTASADDAINDRRFSTSPKLPDLARFSTFSPELLFGGSGSGFLSSDAPPVPSIPNSPAVGSFPESATSTAKQPQPTLSSVPEGVGSTSRNASPFSTSSGESASAPPIRDSAATATTAITSSSLDDTASTAAGARGSADSTPSSVDVPAAAGGLAAAMAAESRKSSSSGVQALSETATAPAAEINTNTDANTDEVQPTSATSNYSTDPMIAMTAPLNPYRLSSMVPFMPPPVTTPKGPRDMQAAETSSTVESTPTTNSPVKESDVLREEIIRTLSPVKMTHSGESLEGAVQEPQESTVAGDKDTETNDHDNTPAQTRSDHARTLTRESSYLQDVYDDYWTPDDASGNETYTVSDPPPPIPPLASAGAGAGSASGSGPTPAALAAAVAATAAAGAAAFAASGSSSSTVDDPTPQQQPPAPEPRHTHQLPSQQGLTPTSSSAPLAAAAAAPAPSPSPTPSTGGLPGAFPSSNAPSPGTQPAPSSVFVQAPATAAAQAAFSKAPALRRRFSWEAEPEQPADAASGTNAFTAVRASTMAHVPSPPPPGPAPAQSQSQSQSPPPSLGGMQVSSPVSTVPPPNELQHDRTVSPHPDTNTVVSAVSTSTVAPELTAPSPVSDAAVAGATGSTTGPTAAAAPVDGHVGPDSSDPSSQEAARQPQAQTQAPVRSMLDVGDAPAPTPIRSMLDVGDDPLPKQLVNRISTAESMQSATSYQSQSQAYPQAYPQAQTQAQTQAQAQAQVSPTAAPSIQVYQPAEAPAAAPTGAPAHNNPALFGSGTEGTGQFLTLRQCMAFGTHHERMAKLAETRRDYAAADSGLSSWLQSMTAVPEYARAAYAPLFDNHVGGAGPAPSSSSVAASRPVAAVAATISRVPHVHVAVPSGTQISNKSKEIFSVATGKAGKGLLALRKKGFHKKSAN